MNGVYPVITLYQPWATWIIRGWKTIETRTHNKFACLNHQTILIHAGLTTDKNSLATENPYLTLQQINSNPDEIINGHLLGIAHVANYSRLRGDHSSASLIDCEFTERYGLFLTDIKPLSAPIKESGSMGIWYYDLLNKKKVKKPKIQTEIFNQ